MAEEIDNKQQVPPQQKVEENELPEVQNELSKISGVPKQSIVIIVLVCGIFIYIFFTLFFNNQKKEVVVAPVVTETKKIQDSEDNIPEIPKLPEPPKLEIPDALPPPPAPPITVPLPEPTAPSLPVEESPKVAPPFTPPALSSNLTMSDEEKKRLQAKRKSSIVLIAGVVPPKTPEQITEEARFKNRGDMSLILGRGKLLDAVLETAINSDFGGEVKAIISRDIFSEANKVILIPKGSKIFGSYSNSTESYGRINIVWSRIDLTNGYTIDLEGITVDNLGRKGEQGRVDNKFKERFANAVLLSSFNIAFANALDKVIAPPINSQAAATNTAEATQIQNLAQSISSGAGDENAKIAMICTQVLQAITDKTSSAYMSMSQSCTTAQNPGGGSSPADRLTALLQAVNTAAASLITTSATASNPTQAQQASTQAFTDVTDTLKNMVESQEFKQTVTIDQGTEIKIYVNKDYKFPKAVLQKSRLLK